jgi:hypothetical protein
MPRKLDEILTEAVKLINPRKDNVEAFRAQLKVRIDMARQIHEETANMPPPGEMKARAEAYLTALHAAKKRARAFHGPPAHSTSQIYPWDNFLAELDREIMWVEPTATGLVVPHGSQQRDTVADLAAFMARDLIDPDPYRHPENRGKDLPAIDCPWRQRAKLTDGGPWLKLATLIYEGATGEYNRDMMKYCREVDEPRKPRYLASGLTFKAPS